MNPEYPIFSTTLCYLERDDAYLMLHRVKKQDDYNLVSYTHLTLPTTPYV